MSTASVAEALAALGGLLDDLPVDPEELGRPRIGQDMCAAAKRGRLTPTDQI